MITHEKAIKDLIDVMDEFELWLEDKSNTIDTNGSKSDASFRKAFAIANAYKRALEKYRECKKRIEYDEQ